MQSTLISRESDPHDAFMVEPDVVLAARADHAPPDPISSLLTPPIHPAPELAARPAPGLAARPAPELAARPASLRRRYRRRCRQSIRRLARRPTTISRSRATSTSRANGHRGVNGRAASPSVSCSRSVARLLPRAGIITVIRPGIRSGPLSRTGRRSRWRLSGRQQPAPLRNRPYPSPRRIRHLHSRRQRHNRRQRHSLRKTQHRRPLRSRRLRRSPRKTQHRKVRHHKIRLHKARPHKLQPRPLLLHQPPPHRTRRSRCNRWHRTLPRWDNRSQHSRRVSSSSKPARTKWRSRSRATSPRLTWPGLPSPEHRRRNLHHPLPWSRAYAPRSPPRFRRDQPRRRRASHGRHTRRKPPPRCRQRSQRRRCRRRNPRPRRCSMSRARKRSIRPTAIR